MTTKFFLFSVVAVLMALGQSVFGAQTYTVYIPTLNANESVVAYATPQNYGAAGNGTTDDTAAFQNAINACSAAGGGIIYVPKATYAFHGNLNLPENVSLHGDWTDWTTGTGGCVGTTFAIYTTGAANGTPFFQANGGTGITGINFWYPNQNPNSITPYPYTIAAANDATIRNIVLVNSYQGINANWAAHHVIETVRGSPLFIGFLGGQMYDVAHMNDVNFSPNAWAVSKLAGAPSAGGAYATWMLANGTGMLWGEVEGEFIHGLTISGYKIGLDSEGGGTGTSVYQANITNCATAVVWNEGGMSACGSTFSGNVGISRTSSDGVNDQFDGCTITGTSGTAVNVVGNSTSTTFQFHNCTITNAIETNGAVVNLTNCTLNGSQQAILGSNVNTRAYFTGCTFNSSQNIPNYGSSSNLQVTSGAAVTYALPNIPWSTFTTKLATCKPAKTTLFLASTYGATGNGTTDDTADIQKALTAAGSNGGGIVYLAPGTYKTSTTLTVPTGVKFQGIWEGQHDYDSSAVGSTIQPTGGQGGTTGPVAVSLSASSGLVGVSFNYPVQNGASSPISFPATIQGNGANVYMIGVQADSSYIFLDLDTHACTTHYADTLNGYALSQYVKVGGGSTGSIVNVTGAGGGFATTTWLTMGNCTETVDSCFVYGVQSLLNTATESSKGPTLNAINIGQDGSVSGFTFASAASTINIVNASAADWAMGTASNDDYAASQFVQSTTAFKGTAHFFAPYNWAAPSQDFDIKGGTVTAEDYYASVGGPTDTISGGVFHLVNYVSATYGSIVETFGASAGISGQTNEVIGTIIFDGLTVDNLNSGNPINAWGNYILSSGSPENGILCNLVCQDSGMNLDNGGSTSEGSDVTQYYAAGQINQLWLLTSVGGGYYNLICQTSGMALDNDNSSSNGTSLIQWPPGGNNTNQGWEFVNVGGSYPYQLINQADGKAMDNGGSTTAGTNVEQNTQASGNSDPNQNWMVQPIGVQSLSGGFYQLVCVTSGMVLDNEGSTTAGTPCHQWASQTNNPNQVWALAPCGQYGNDTYFNLVCLDSGMALDDNNATGNGTPVVQNPPTAGDANQEWEVIYGTDYCTLINLANGLALDNEGSTSEGNGIWQWTPQPGNTNQEWQFVMSSTTPPSGSVYNLICNESGMVLDNGGSTSSASALVQNPLVYNDTDQEWKLTSTTNGYYTLVCQDSGMALDNVGSTSDGTAVEQVTSKSGDTNQEWTLVGQGNGYYSLLCLSSGMALDNDGSTTAGTTVVQWTSGSNNPHQEWQFNPAP